MCEVDHRNRSSGEIEGLVPRVHHDFDGVGIDELVAADDPADQIYTGNGWVRAHGDERGGDHIWSDHRLVTLDHNDDVGPLGLGFDYFNGFGYPVAPPFIRGRSQKHRATETFDHCSDLPIARP